MFRDYTDDEKRALDSIIRPAKIKQGVSGRFKLRVLKRGIILRESGWSKNLIVNSWFDWLFQNVATTGFMGFVAGSGTATPDVTDTQLQSFLGGGGQFQEAWLTTNSTVSPRGFTVGVRCRAAEGAVVGNVAEIAMCRGGSGSGVPNNSSPLMNRARVLDEMSAPTTVAVASDEILEVIYEFTFFAIDGATGTLTINIDGTPTDFDYEIRPVSMNHSSSWKISASITGTVDSTNSWVLFNPSAFPSVGTTGQTRCYVTGETTFGDPSSSSVPAGYSASNLFTSRINGTYTPGSRTRDFTIRLPLNNGNIAAPGIRSINLVLNESTNTSAWCCHQMLLDGPFLKPNTHVFDLPITVSMDNA